MKDMFVGGEKTGQLQDVHRTICRRIPLVTKDVEMCRCVDGFNLGGGRIWDDRQRRVREQNNCVSRRRPKTHCMIFICKNALFDLFGEL